MRHFIDNFIIKASFALLLCSQAIVSSKPLSNQHDFSSLIPESPGRTSIRNLSPRQKDVGLCPVVGQGTVTEHPDLTLFWAQRATGLDLTKELIATSNPKPRDVNLGIVDGGTLDKRLLPMTLSQGEVLARPPPEEYAEGGGKDDHKLQTANLMVASSRYGVAPNGRLVSDSNILDNQESPKPHDVNQSMDHFRLTNSPEIINVSMALYRTGAGYEDLTRLAKHAVLVIASGNISKPEGNERLRNEHGTISVGSIDPTGALSSFDISYTQEGTDIVAPSGSEVTSWVEGTEVKFGGTSGATPQVSGALAIALGYLPKIENLEERYRISKLLLKKTATPTLGSEGDPNGYGAGLLNIYKLARTAKLLGEKKVSLKDIETELSKISFIEEAERYLEEAEILIQKNDLISQCRAFDLFRKAFHLADNSTRGRALLVSASQGIAQFLKKSGFDLEAQLYENMNSLGLMRNIRKVKSLKSRHLVAMVKASQVLPHGPERTALERELLKLYPEYKNSSFSMEGFILHSRNPNQTLLKELLKKKIWDDKVFDASLAIPTSKVGNLPPKGNDLPSDLFDAGLIDPLSKLSEEDRTAFLSRMSPEVAISYADELKGKGYAGLLQQLKAHPGHPELLRSIGTNFVSASANHQAEALSYLKSYAGSDGEKRVSVMVALRDSLPEQNFFFDKWFEEADPHQKARMVHALVKARPTGWQRVFETASASGSTEELKINALNALSAETPEQASLLGAWILREMKKESTSRELRGALVSATSEKIRLSQALEVFKRALPETQLHKQIAASLWGRYVENPLEVGPLMEHLVAAGGEEVDWILFRDALEMKETKGISIPYLTARFLPMLQEEKEEKLESIREFNETRFKSERSRELAAWDEQDLKLLEALERDIKSRLKN